MKSFGNRMKKYEKSASYQLPLGMPVIMRIDGRVFHTFTQDLDKPFDHLAWKFRSEPSGRYRPLEIGRQHILSGRSAARVELDFRLYVDWSDPPAHYTMEILFEVERESSAD